MKVDRPKSRFEKNTLMRINPHKGIGYVFTVYFFLHSVSFFNENPFLISYRINRHGIEL